MHFNFHIKYIWLINRKIISYLKIQNSEPQLDIQAFILSFSNTKPKDSTKTPTNIRLHFPTKASQIYQLHCGKRHVHPNTAPHIPEESFQSAVYLTPNYHVVFSSLLSLFNTRVPQLPLYRVRNPSFLFPHIHCPHLFYRQQKMACRLLYSVADSTTDYIQMVLNSFSYFTSILPAGLILLYSHPLDFESIR